MLETDDDDFNKTEINEKHAQEVVRAMRAAFERRAYTRGHPSLQGSLARRRSKRRVALPYAARVLSHGGQGLAPVIIDASTLSWPNGLSGELYACRMSCSEGVVLGPMG